MDKEKEIEEMSNVIAEICEKQSKKYKCDDCNNCMAEFLLNAGYRKADEVRKETAKEILQDLYDEASKYCDETMGLDTYEIKQLSKKYGVEVDE